MLKFETAFIQCLKDGVYPGPSNINERKKPDGRRFNRLNGQETKKRLELMYAFGIPYQRGNPIEFDERMSYAPTRYNVGEIPEYPYLTEDDGFVNGIKKPEVGYRKHEIQDPNESWNLKRK
jgi:hypothetical protein